MLIINPGKTATTQTTAKHKNPPAQRAQKNGAQRPQAERTVTVRVAVRVRTVTVRVAVRVRTVTVRVAVRVRTVTVRVAVAPAVQAEKGKGKRISAGAKTASPPQTPLRPFCARLYSPPTQRTRADNSPFACSFFLRCALSSLPPNPPSRKGATQKKI